MRPLVLVVDDHATNIKLLRFLLESRGMDVITARSAPEAERALEASSPRLVLMDVQLPGTDGLTLTRRLRADPRYADLKIVAVTAYAMARDEAAAREAGCDGFIAKPIDTRAVGELVERLVKSAP